MLNEKNMCHSDRSLLCSGISDPILRVVIYSAVYMHIYGIKTIISTIYLNIVSFLQRGGWGVRINANYIDAS